MEGIYFKPFYYGDANCYLTKIRAEVQSLLLSSLIGDCHKLSLPEAEVETLHGMRINNYRYARGSSKTGQREKANCCEAPISLSQPNGDTWSTTHQPDCSGQGLK